ncbi:hypothetical protein GGR54DRAFT_646479 [Hypoxylon sp. NC1633]|nr:hypothetical protein GGR54DRAFT_646479 [Hypoxylon sp. NC1633]
MSEPEYWNTNFMDFDQPTYPAPYSNEMDGGFASFYDEGNWYTELPTYDAVGLQETLYPMTTYASDTIETLAPAAVFETHEPDMHLLNGDQWHPRHASPTRGVLQPSLVHGEAQVMRTPDPAHEIGLAQPWLSIPAPSSSFPVICGLHGCTVVSFFDWDLVRHRRLPHARGHIVVQKSPFLCKCGLEYAKLDTLFRHIRGFQDSPPEFRCQECSRIFPRKDNLKQHLRHGHNFSDTAIEAEYPGLRGREVGRHVISVCHVKGCSCHRGDEFSSLPIEDRKTDAPFAKQSDYTKHMRDEHDWSPYHCDVRGCDRVGKKGYFNQKALLKHKREKHPDAEPLALSPREE